MEILSAEQKLLIKVLSFTHKRLLREALFCAYYNIHRKSAFIGANNPSNNHFRKIIKIAIYIL